MTTRNYKQVQDIPQTDVPTIQPIYVTSGGGAIVVIAILLFSIVVMWVTSRDEHSGWAGIWGTAAFFTIAKTIGLLAVNGGLASMWSDWQRERTIRNRDRQQFSLWQAQSTLHVVDPTPLPYESPALPQPQPPSFVPAIPRIADNVRVDASNFVLQLFDTSNGRPLPSKITKNKGQIQHASPSQEAIEYLMSLGIVHREGGKQLYWSPHYPTMHDALNAIRTGRRPSYDEGKDEDKKEDNDAIQSQEWRD